MIKILGIPSILGCNTRGCDLAPEQIRSSFLHSSFENSSLLYDDLGDLNVNNIFQEINTKAKNLDQIIEIVNLSCETISTNSKPEDKILCLGGDHSVAMGSIFGTTERFGSEDSFLIWIDAHGDSNSPETSPTGNIHGMPLATVLGDSLFSNWNYSSILKQNVIVLGVKDVEDAEWDYFHKNNITVYSMDDIVEIGIGEIWKEIQNRVGNKNLHVSMDIDGLDNFIAPGTGIINNGGINYREIKFLARKLSTLNLKALDVVEINPLNDVNNKTSELAVELIADYMGGKWSEYEKYLAQSKQKTLSKA